MCSGKIGSTGELLFRIPLTAEASSTQQALPSARKKCPIPATQILARSVEHASVLSIARLKPDDFQKHTSI